MRLNEALKRVKKATPGEPLILGYAVAVLSILAALIIALWMRMELGQPSTPIVVLFLCGVMFSAWFGGIGPGLLSIALSLLAIDYYFATPIHSFAVDIKEIPRLLIFTLSAFFIGSLSAAQRSKADSLRQARDVLDETVQDLNRTNQALRTENAERKHAEALLHAKEQEFRAIVENAPDQIIRYDREFRRAYVNPAVAKNYGLPAEALIGKPIGSVLQDAGLDVTEDALAHVRQKIAGVFATGKSYEYELTWPMPAGLTYLSVRLFPELDLNGSVVNVLGISRDITKRKQAEDALRRSEDHLRLIIDTIPTMAWSLQPDGAIDFVNQRWMDYTGLSLEEAIAKPTSTLHPDDLPGAMAEWGAKMAAEEPFEGEIRLRRADGEYRWFLVRTDPLRDEQGNLVKWYGASIDIEDRKQAEEKLKQSESQLAEAQRLAHVGSFDWDLRSNAVTWSDELYRIFCLEPGKIRVRGDAMAFIHAEDRDLVLSTVKSAVKNKEPYSFYYRVLRPDGDERIVHSRGQIVSDQDGSPIKVLGATQDVTELKRAEEKLKATSAQLRALSQSVQSAREEEATRIAREIHDELGSSLSRLKWDLELVGKEYLQVEGVANLSKLQEKITAMRALIDDTIDAIRRISAELRPSALDDLGLLAAIRWHARQFEVRTGIVTLLDSSFEDIDLTDQQSTAVFRIFEEAMTNVLRHAQATQVDIKLEVENADLLLTIRDNGRGITEAEKTNRLSLGLLGMRERATLIGGRLDIEGSEEGGTVVTLRLTVA
jgi:PAS domain S-box-containing protein